MKFKLTNSRRILILSVTILATILAIIFGSSFYVAKNARKSIEYAGGAEYVIQVESQGKEASAIASDVANEIYERIDSLGVKGVSIEPQKSSQEGSASIRVTYPGITNEQEIQDIQDQITSKPQLVFTDIQGRPIFTRTGNFDENTINSITDISDFDWLHETYVPLSEQGTKVITGQNGEYKVQMAIDKLKTNEWAKATRYISSQPEGQKQVLTWLNIGELIKKLKTTPGAQGSSIWDESNHNIWNAIHIDNNPSNPFRFKTIENIPNYLISNATVSQTLSQSTFVLEGNFSSGEAQDISRKINFGAAHYTLKPLYSNVIDPTYGENAFKKVLIAGLIVFSFIAIFLIVNYGLLGALSTISIALYMFITLTLFTVMRGEYSPESIAALIIGIGMSVDANIITFERLKHEYYAGNNIQKSYSVSNKKSLSSIIDGNITTLIIAVVLFYFGTRNIIGLSVTLMLSILFTFVIMLGFTRVLSGLVVKTKYFDNKPQWLGIKPKIDLAIQKKINSVNYIKSSKWFSWFSGAIILAGVIVFTITAALARGVAGGFKLSNEFKSNTIIQLKINSATEEQTFRSILADNFVSTEDVYEIYDDNNQLDWIKVNSEKDLNVQKIKEDTISKINPTSTHFLIQNTTSEMAKKLLKDAMIAIAIAMVLIVVYTLIRFRWTYSVSAIVALVHDGLIVTAVFVFGRIEISPVFIAGLLTILGYSINDTIVTFDRIRERMNSHMGVMDEAHVKNLANDAIKDTLKRSLWTSLTTILAIIVLMSFGNATKMSFNLAMLIGLISGTYSSIFIATYLWTKLETFRLSRINKRLQKGFWNVSSIEEQTFSGINDFKP